MKDDNVIRYAKFNSINLSDPFFNSLKEDYAEFSQWFLRKTNEKAFISMNDNGFLQGFLYLKIEKGPITDVSPPINSPLVLKIGTFKIEAHNTKLGERFVKKVFDFAIENQISSIYVTIFDQHIGLINLLSRYGFYQYASKDTQNGCEGVYLKSFENLSNNVSLDYPVIDITRNKWLLGVYERYHTALFPDSILNNEDCSIIKDVSHTNSIHKVYVGGAMDMPRIQSRDILVIYRINEKGYTPYFHNVATSLCVVEDIMPYTSFNNDEDFFEYAEARSVFEKDDLKYWIKKNPRGLHAIKMMYNVALSSRLIMKRLIEDVGIPYEGYWGLRQITDNNLRKIIELGQVYEGLIVN